MTNLDPAIARQQAIVKKVYQAFFGPSRHEEKPADREIINRGNNYRLPFAGGELMVTSWGEVDRPAVLLMHGWGGSRAQMTGFVDPLLSAGYRVVAYDQPAHGESDGRITNLIEIAPTMNLVVQQEGPFDAIIAHSFGTLITTYAIVNLNFPPPSKLVYFGAFNRLLDSLPRFQVMAKLSDEIMNGFREMITEEFGEGVLDAIANETLAPQIQVPALLFHDVNDDVTPIEDTRAIARAWDGAKLIETNGLNHRGALQSKEVHEQVIQFLRN